MKKRISKKHNLTFLPEIWNGLVEDAEKAGVSVSQFISDLYTKSKNTMKSLILSIAILTVLASCSKKDEPTPTKRGTFKMSYSVSATNNFAFDTKIELKFGHYSNGGKTTEYSYLDTKTYTIDQSKKVKFLFDTLVTADLVTVSIVSQSLRDNPKINYSYNDYEIFNSTIDYSAVNSGYSRDIKF
jgi:hypothetical protein